jgi:hypothetical protein
MLGSSSTTRSLASVCGAAMTPIIYPYAVPLLD